MSESAPVTVIEMPEFLSAMRKLMDDAGRATVVDYLAYNPTAGNLMRGTGGIRKIRWSLEGRGKRGGARVIYFYHSNDLPLFLLTAYAKNVKADLTQTDRNDFRRLTKLLVERYGKGKQ